MFLKCALEFLTKFQSINRCAGLPGPPDLGLAVNLNIFTLFSVYHILYLEFLYTW